LLFEIPYIFKDASYVLKDDPYLENEGFIYGKKTV